MKAQLQPRQRAGARAGPSVRLPPFDEVVARHGGDVWRFAASQVGPDRADDVFQDTMVAALSAYPSLRDPAALRSWLLRIAARKSADLFRASARAPVAVDNPDPGGAPEPEPPDAQLWARVRELPGKQRQAVGLRFVLDLGYQAIGAAMGTSEEAARRNVFEGLATLRRHYAADGAGDLPPSPSGAEPHVDEPTGDRSCGSGPS